MSISIIPQKLDDIATWMTPAQTTLPQTTLPQALRGIFFMDGNPLPDDCLTMHGSAWDEKTLSLAVSVTAPLQWTFHRSIFGRLLLHGAQLARFNYTIKFEDESLTQAEIIPKILGITVPKWIVHLTMHRDENASESISDGAKHGDLWQRKNVWLGGLPRIGEYVLRRIVDEQGQHTPAFADMLSKVDSECWVIAQTPITTPATTDEA